MNENEAKTMDAGNIAATSKGSVLDSIADASKVLFGEIGATVRQLGGKRQKELQSAQNMHLARMQSYNKEEKPKSNAIWVVLGIFAAVVIAAIIIKKR